MKKLIRFIFFICFVFSAVTFSVVAFFHNHLADNYCVAKGDTLSFNNAMLKCTESSNVLAVGQSKQTNLSGESVTVKLFNLIPVKNVNVTAVENSEVLVLGTPFGLKLFTEGVLVVGYSDVETENGSVNPSMNSGIKIGDIILKINNTAVESNNDVQSLVKKNCSKALNITIKRNDNVFSVSVSPSLSKNDGAYKIGLWIRDSSAGIGTLTFYDPKLNILAGLGHGICDTDTGELLPCESGQFVEAEIVGIKKSSKKKTGELQGIFSGGKISNLSKNDITGVYGSGCKTQMDGITMPIVLKQEIEVGKAQILTTLDGGEPQYYDCVIKKVYHNDSSKIKNMIIEVTDPELLKKTGGIVQGMSGSPLIQNGKLIGAVTHVLVDDPTKGYAIFAENMLETAQSVGQGFAPAEKIKDAS